MYWWFFLGYKINKAITNSVGGSEVLQTTEKHKACFSFSKLISTFEKEKPEFFKNKEIPQNY